MTIDFTVNPNDLSLKTLYRVARLANKHCYFHGCQIKSAECSAVITILDNLIKTDYRKYDAVHGSGEYYFKCQTSDRYADGNWMIKAKRELSESRMYASKYNKQTSTKGVTIYPDKG